MKKFNLIYFILFSIFLFSNNVYADKQKCFLTEASCNISDWMTKNSLQIDKDTKKTYDSELNSLYIEETKVLIWNIKENDIEILNKIKKNYNSKIDMHTSIIKEKNISKTDISKYKYFINNIKNEIKKIDEIIKSIEKYNKNKLNTNNKSEIEYIKIIENKNMYNVFSLNFNSLKEKLKTLNNIYWKEISFLNKYYYNDLSNNCINEVNTDKKTDKCKHIEQFNTKYIYTYDEKIKLWKSTILNEYLTWFIQNNYWENSNSEINTALMLSSKAFVDVATDWKNTLMEKIKKEPIKFNGKNFITEKIVTDTIKKKINEKSVQQKLLFDALYKSLYTNIDSILILELDKFDKLLQRKSIIPKSDFYLKNEELKKINNLMIKKDLESSLISKLKDANQWEMFDIYREFISQVSSMKSLPWMKKNAFITTTLVIDNYYKTIDKLSINSYLNDALKHYYEKIQYNKDLTKIYFNIQ